MNPSHYPSLELCKKLHSIGMRGVGEYGYAEWQCVNGVGGDFTKTEFTSKESFYNIGKRKSEGGKWMSLSWIFIEAYSVMEMWDIMPQYIQKRHRDDDFYKSDLRITKEDVNYHQIEECESIIGFPILHNNTFPDCLAEMILWLHENNYISFTK